MKRKLCSVLGAVLMIVFTLMACSSSDDESPLSSKKTIDTYSLAGVAGTINETGKTIAVTVPFGTTVNNLAATFTTTGKKVRVGSTVQESGTTANNFTSPLDYKVTAANGSSVTYTVTVTVAPSTAKAITAFSFASPAAVGAITESTHSIALSVPAGTNVTALVATFTTTGPSVKVGSTIQLTGTTPNTFASPLIYTVTAADASIQNYTVTVTVAPGGFWTQKANFGGTARRGAVGFSIGTKGYIGTGYDGTALKDDFWMYDSVAGTWSQKAVFAGGARSDAVGFSIGTKGYVGTGYDGTAILKQDFYEYDSVGDAWTAKADFGATVGGTPRRDAVGFSIGTKGYVGTGDDGTITLTKDFYEYDPAGDAWTKKADFGGTARKDAVGFAITKGYIGTGYDGAYKNDFYEYNPATDLWAKKADFGGEARSSAVGFGSFCTNGYIGTGSTLCSYFKDFWEYDPVANTWTQRTYFGGAERDSAVGFLIGGVGYIGTGWNGTVYYKDFWEYQP